MSKFNEVVDLAVEAAKRGMIVIEQIKSGFIAYYHVGFGVDRVIYEYYQEETLDLYISELVCVIAEGKTEKFVVETAEDVERIKQGATVRLANGNVIVTEQNSTGLFYVNENMYWVNLDYSILKDAIIEQKGAVK